MNVKNGLSIILAAICLCSCSSGGGSLPDSWRQSWDNPSVMDRPVKIAHRIPADESPYGGDYFAFLRDSCGLGGIIVNYSGKNYLKDDGNWAFLVDEVRRAEEAGLRVWIYDEEGYPSPAAGGRVLEANPDLEAKELVRDPSGRIFVRNSYEYTHACNNYGALRRYPDPGSPETMNIFTRVTHQATKDHLGDELFSKVESFFTDEPSYMGVNLGPIPEKVRNTVRVQDEPDPKKPLLPMLPWTDGVDKEYETLYGEPLSLQSLFGGSSEADKTVRQRYWALMGERFRANYCDALMKWCHDAGTLSSGHFLSEEQVIRHTPLYGNMLLVERGLDIPGLDMLDTDPPTWNTGDCWLIASLPESAAYLDGKRRVMTEVSDHNQRVLGDHPATIEAMKGTAACHIAGGVTDLTLYYGLWYDEPFSYRSVSGFKSYSEFVGRINAIVREAEPLKKVLLYYPAYDLQREFIPQSEPLMDEGNQSETMKTVIGSFFTTGRSMAQAQIPFVLADYLALSDAAVRDGSIVIGPHSFDAIVLPEGVTLPQSVKELTAAFAAAGGKVLSSSRDCTAQEILSKVSPSERFSPSIPQLTFGKFERDGRTIYLVLNASDEEYSGTLSVPFSGRWTVADPDSGEVTSVAAASKDGDALLPVTLKPLQTLLYISR